MFFNGTGTELSGGYDQRVRFISEPMTYVEDGVIYSPPFNPVIIHGAPIDPIPVQPKKLPHNRQSPIVYVTTTPTTPAPTPTTPAPTPTTPTKEAVKEETETDLIFGYPRTAVYIAGGVAGLLGLYMVSQGGKGK